MSVRQHIPESDFNRSLPVNPPYEISGDLSEIVSAFVSSTSDQLDAVIEESLGRLGRVLDMDFATVLLFDRNRGFYEVTHQWVGPAVKIEPGFLGLRVDESFAWLHQELAKEVPFLISRLSDWPAQAELERAACERVGIKSVLWVPFRAGTDVKGYVAYNTTRDERCWDDLAVARLRLFGGILSSALRRCIAEQSLAELRAFEVLTSELASGFVKALEDDDIDDLITDALKQIGQCLGLERTFLVKFSDYLGADRDRVLGWLADGLLPDPDFLNSHWEDQFPWAAGTIRAGTPIVCQDMLDLPAEASAEKRYLRQQGIRAGVLVPVKTAEGVIGSLIVDSRQTRTWSDRLVERLHLTGELFGNLLAREAAERRTNEAYEEIAQLKDQLAAENAYLQEEIQVNEQHDEIIGNSSAILFVLGQVEQVAPTDATVLVTGETGTGKELIARAIHRLSSRSDRHMVTVNCSALPATLIEAELFGREKGAFTGALARQLGRFEAANGSTLFLDEIGELPLELQAKLLRVLQSGEFERLGSTKTLQVDIRLVAATNRDLVRLVEEGRFRKDLFYRLHVFPIDVPPLRERVEDIPALAWTFVQEFGRRMGKSIETISRRSMLELQQYPWPGNVRELLNIVERSMILSRGPKLNVPLASRERECVGASSLSMADTERFHMEAVLARTNWRVRGPGGAAELLDLKPSTLESRMKKYGMTRPS